MVKIECVRTQCYESFLVSRQGVVMAREIRHRAWSPNLGLSSFTPQGLRDSLHPRAAKARFLFPSLTS